MKKGLSLSTTLFVIFLVLKLTGLITWSWWYVTMPLWLGFAITLSICGIIFLGALALAFIFGGRK